MIKEAAIKRIYDGRVWTGRRHSAVISKIISEGHTKTVGHDEFIQGFVTDDGFFVDRHEAYILALACGQITPGASCAPPTLMSEDLY